MDPRYTGRPPSPGRYGPSGRSSTGRTDVYPPDYDRYYAPTRTSRESVVPGPRSSAERVVIPRSDTTRLHRDSLSRAPRDDYAVPIRRDPPPTVARRPLSVITTSESPNRYRPVISSAADNAPSPYKSRPREDDSYYVLPASSSHHHHRHFSAGGEDSHRYLDAGRDRRAEKGGYRSSGPSKGSIDYSRNLPQIREPRDAQDRDYGYEYTNRKEQVYRDTAPRLRNRRGSDVGPRERIYTEDGQKGSRDSGPPVTTRGFSKIDPNGAVRREYRVQRENDPPSRDNSLVRNNRDDRDSNRLRPPRGAVALHQDNNDGYSSNIEDRARERHHKHKRNESIDRESDRNSGNRHYDERRFEERAKTHNQIDSEDKHHRSHRHRETSEDRYGSHVHGRHRERDDEDDRERRHRDEPRKEKHDRHEKQEKHDHKKLAEGIGLGAAGAAATGLIAETISKHRRDKDVSDVENDNSGREKSRRHDRHRNTADQENGSPSDETDEGYRERRRRRRREREEKDRRTREEEEPGAAKDGGRSGTQDRSSKMAEDRVDTDEEDDRRSRRRHRKERKDSGESSYDEAARQNKERSRVRVVSPPKDPPKKPKGILRPPTQKFPEDPTSIREGVAPLKDAGNKGIPPNARWTKIDRRLVNPAALELAKERYEERPDYVIVLRVLSKDEIEKFAEITQELRNRRARDEGETRAIEPAHRDYDSEDEPPHQIAAVPYNQPEPLPTRDRSIANDLQPHLAAKTPAMAETVVNAHHQRAAVGQDVNVADDSASDRPGLPSGGSYHRVAPPNVQPPSSIPIPMYPPMPPASAPVNQGPYMPPSIPTVQDPAASWHGGVPVGAAMGAYPTPPSQPHSQPHSQGHTPPPPAPQPQPQQVPPIPPKEAADPYPAVSGGYQPQGVQ